MSVAKQHKPRFRLRSILLLVNLFVLIAPIGSIYSFRLYENELVRQTESELIAQGAYIAAMVKHALQAPPAYGLPVAVKHERMNEKYPAITPTLDLATATIHPPRPEAVQATAPDPAALQAGNRVFPVLEEATLTTLAGVRVTDYRGVVVAGRAEVGLSLANSEEVAAALNGNISALLRQRISDHPPPALASISRGTGIRIFVAMPIIRHEHVIGTVLLSRSPRNVLKGLYDNLQSILIAGSIMLGITISLALLTSYAISRPIYALIGQTKRIARGEREIEPIKEPVTQELAFLSDHITSMAHTIAERSDYIRNFAMHVSHEFKTPLTAIQGAIELIQEHGHSMPSEQFQKFLCNITKDTDRLKILVSRLLELARADVMQSTEETCHLLSIIQHLQSDCQSKGIVLIANTMDHIILPMPADMAHTVFNNLVENSCQHGATEMIVSAAYLNHKLVITFQDNGQGISPANAEKLFTPFFTTKREQGGTGLGLVIVRSLLAAYKADVECIPQDKGACFSLSFSL